MLAVLPLCRTVDSSAIYGLVFEAQDLGPSGLGYVGMLRDRRVRAIRNIRFAVHDSESRAYGSRSCEII